MDTSDLMNFENSNYYDGFESTNINVVVLSKLEITQMIDLLAKPSNTETLRKALDELCVFIKNFDKYESFDWSESFSNILVCLFDHLKNQDVFYILLPYDFNQSESFQITFISLQNVIQTKALAALRELLQNKSMEFSNYIELTILSLIEQYKDTPNEASKVVEDVVYTAAIRLPPESSIRVLKPLIEAAEYPKNLIAIRMLQKILETLNEDLCRKIVSDILSALLTVSFRFDWAQINSSIDFFFEFRF
jgi:hypothetical protein